MIRTLLTEVGLFVTPFALYAIFLWVTRAGLLHPDSWPVSRTVLLGIVALGLVLGSFLYFAQYTGAPVGSQYVPAHTENGKFVPGTLR